MKCRCENLESMLISGVMDGCVYVGPEGFESDEELMSWVQLSLGFVMTLPPR